MNCATWLKVWFFIIYSPLDNCCVMNYVFERPICIAKKPLWRSSWKIFKSCFYMVCIIGKLLSIFPTTIGDFFSKNYHSVRCWLVTEFLFQEWMLGLWKTKWLYRHRFAPACKQCLDSAYCLKYYLFRVQLAMLLPSWVLEATLFFIITRKIEP